LLDTPNSVVVMVKAGRGAAVVAAEDEAVAEAAE